MKTQIKFIFAGLCLALFLIPKISSGQLACNYQIQNNTACTVTVDIQWMTPDAMGLCNTVCGTTGPQFISPGGSQSFTCPGCINLCDIIVTLVGMGSSSLGVSVDSANPSSPSSPLPPGSCPGPNTYSMNWSSNITVIDN